MRASESIAQIIIIATTKAEVKRKSEIKSETMITQRKSAP
jgi:hypothetical protein